MTIEVFNLLATLIVAAAATWIALTANRLANNANSISEQASKLEADKHLIAWAEKVIGTFSSAIALRYDDNIENPAFQKARRDVRAMLFSDLRCGQLFLKNTSNTAHPALKTISDLLACVDRGMPYQKAINFQIRNDAATKMNELAKKFIASVQSTVGNHWTRK